MNKTYRLAFNILGHKVYRLSRSVPKRSAYKIFFKKGTTKRVLLIVAPSNFLCIKSCDKRYSFVYHHNYVLTQEHLWKLDHGKFKTFKKGEITDDYRYACRRDCGC